MIYNGKLNGSAYINVIEEALPMFIQNTFDTDNNNWVYMHDNAPSHRAVYTKSWMKENKTNLLIWPPVLLILIRSRTCGIIWIDS